MGEQVGGRARLVELGVRVAGRGSWVVGRGSWVLRMARTSMMTLSLQLPYAKQLTSSFHCHKRRVPIGSTIAPRTTKCRYRTFCSRVDGEYVQRMRYSKWNKRSQDQE